MHKHGQERLQRIRFYTVDLTKTEGRAEFGCPKCGIEMSPDDETEDVYTILETVMKGDCLERIVLKCNKCGSRVHLIGFSSSNEYMPQ